MFGTTLDIAIVTLCAKLAPTPAAVRDLNMAACFIGTTPGGSEEFAEFASVCLPTMTELRSLR